jgi:hypothetical protein
MREYNFFSSFKITLKIHFSSESRSVKILYQKFSYKSIGNNLRSLLLYFLECKAP